MTRNTGKFAIATGASTIEAIEADFVTTEGVATAIEGRSVELGGAFLNQDFEGARHVRIVSFALRNELKEFGSR